MRKEDILAFVQRDWTAIAEQKRQWRAEQAKRMTAAEALAIGDELRRYALGLHPDWPTEQQRREDFAMHVRISESLSRVHAFRSR
jgi:hypothetical protein